MRSISTGGGKYILIMAGIIIGIVLLDYYWYDVSKYCREMMRW